MGKANTRLAPDTAVLGEHTADIGTLILLVAVSIAAIIAVFRFGDEQPPPPGVEGAPGELLTVRVRHIIDGDTVIVSRAWSDIRIRLDAIDCPEDGQDWGNVAKAGLIKLIGGRHVQIERHGVDRHGRMLATVYVQQSHDSDWINVNERMVMLGHAWVMRKYLGHLPKCRQRQLNRLEGWARSKRVGLWKTADPIPPWRWRNGG